MKTVATPLFTPESFAALQNPSSRVPGVHLPDTQQVLEFAVQRLINTRRLKRSDARIFHGSLPTNQCLVLPIPPRPHGYCRSRFMNPKGITNEWLMNQVRRIKIQGKECFSFVPVEDVEDIIEVLPGPYLMVDVEDGRATCGLHPEPDVLRKRILESGRSPYVLFEGVDHGIVFGELTLLHHDIGLVGSCDRIGPNVLWLGLSTHGFLALVRCSYFDPSEKRGAPSCGSRIAV